MYLIGPHISTNNKAQQVLDWLQIAPVPVIKMLDYDRTFLERCYQIRPVISQLFYKIDGVIKDKWMGALNK